MLDEDEAVFFANKFEVAESQVRRDYVISHALGALAASVADDVVFFGGTALTRTYLPDLRLSEDIDLIAKGHRSAMAAAIQRAIVKNLRRTVGVPEFTPALVETRHPEPSVMAIDETRIQIQLLSQTGYPAWPSEMRRIEQRYSDAPPAQLRVLTPPAFAAAKLSAWNDRRAARDLYDMWAMATHDMIDADAVRLFSRHGPLTSPEAVSFDGVPSEKQWASALAHQCRPKVSASEAAAVVQQAWSTT